MGIPLCGLPEFASLLAMDRSEWPRCLHWHGWLLGLGTAGERAWSVDRQIFGTAGGRIPADSSEFWNAPDFWDADDLAVGMEPPLCLD